MIGEVAYGFARMNGYKCQHPGCGCNKFYLDQIMPELYELTCVNCSRIIYASQHDNTELYYHIKHIEKQGLVRRLIL